MFKHSVALGYLSSDLPALPPPPPPPKSATVCVCMQQGYKPHLQTPSYLFEKVVKGAGNEGIIKGRNATLLPQTCTCMN